VQKAHRDRDEDEEDKGRIDAEAAPNEKAFQVQSAAAKVFFEEQSGNQKSAEDEKQIDANPAAAPPRGNKRVESGIEVPEGNMPSENEEDREEAQ
jgi:hypothetical protein